MQQPVYAVTERQLRVSANEFVPKQEATLQKLQTALDEMTKRMEALESTLAKAQRDPNTAAPTGRSGSRRIAGRKPPVCYLCGQEGHIKRTCPLNYMGPARMAGGWPTQNYQ